MALEGQQLGRYRLQRLLGKGAMGEVYLAEDTGIDRQVAIKVIRSDVALEPGSDAAQDAVRDFQQEMRIIARLNHATGDALASAAMKEPLARLGAQPRGGTPDDLAKHMKAEHEKWGPIVAKLWLKEE